ncbi:hypothetical protein A2382_01515 [Candidatus Woesebacteria bacterium RIFOXYB1_FULL_38_16]|uniref:SurA N-terminal domain-containing protein n=1 Tax=Candidatus Woesebacteria bacterium RIFOXYB1_FULL_38_16 TaxID=1802538 RepID=A0A1F8CRZ0_9BACT|nr:MAG: hypothetical protein A2382_01515 [Candidatus Woesebacteria bacterium RIFOXYB1_FULL_38_16]
MLYSFDMEESKTEIKAKKRNISGLLGKLFILLVIGVVLYFLKNLFLVGLVNNQPIWRLSVVRELEKQHGQEVTESIMTEILIAQEARKMGVSVLPKDVEDEISKLDAELKTQGQDLETVLAYQGMTREDLVKRMTMQKLIEGMLIDKVQVSDEEVAQYLKDNSNLPEGVSQEEASMKAREALTQQKLQEQFFTWLTEVKKTANVRYFVNY